MVSKSTFGNLAKLSSALFVSICTGIPGVMAQKQMPNVVFIYADDLGFGETEPYGQKTIKTPNLQKLANDGIRFTQFYTGSPVCSPARCTLMTGRHAGHAAIRGNYEMGDFPDSLEGGQMPLPEGAFTIGDLFKQAGYTTGTIGKWGMGMHCTSGDPNKHGFDYFYGYYDQKQAHNYYPSHLWENGQKVVINDGKYFSPHQQITEAPLDPSFYDQFKGRDYAPELMTQKALDYIQKNHTKPFFLYLAYTLPHVSLQAPDSTVQKYVKLLGDEKPYLGQKGYLPVRYPNACYAAMITTLDSYVGRVRAELEKLGLSKNTIIIFSSDNGTTNSMGGVTNGHFNNSGGLKGYKRQLYEGGIRMPFIACWPGKITAGQKSDFKAVQYDLMATFAELLKVETPKTDGISILPEILGNHKTQKTREYIYWELPENGGQVAVRYGKWKGIRYGVKKNPKVEWEIYNIDQDEKETNNLAASYPELIKKFNEIATKEHWQPSLVEWDFINPKISATNDETSKKQKE